MILSHLKVKMKFQLTKPILQNEEILDCLNDLHKTFVVVPIDKASNNVGIICKNFYDQKILLEVVIYGDHYNANHFSHKRARYVISSNPQFCERR